MNGCGPCTLCCKIPGIPERKEGDVVFSLETEDGSKPRGEWCRLCDPKRGCQSYEDRGPTCREFECLWLQTQRSEAPLPIELRPDRVKAMLTPTMDGKAVQVMVAPENWKTWERGPLQRFVALMQEQGVAVFAMDTGDQRAAITRRAAEILKELTQ